MGIATVVHRFVTDLNPIHAEWIIVRAADPQDDPDASLRSHLMNPLCATAMPANRKLDAPSRLSVELKRGDPTLTLHGLGAEEEAMVLVIGFGTTDIRDQFVSAEGAREL